MDERIKNAVVRAAQESGRFLLGSMNSKKGANELEKRARELMVRELRSAMPQISVWGEDESGRQFSICPLDSQINFERRIGPFGAMAAYIEGGMPLFGAICLPESGELLTAERGKGARLDGRKVAISSRSMLSRSLICCGCNVYDERMVPFGIGAIDALARAAALWRNLGSPAFEFLYLATGRIDGIIVPMLESAHAAGYLAMQEAGARVTDGDGRPFSMRSGSIIAANPVLHEEMLGLVQNGLQA